MGVGRHTRKRRLCQIAEQIVIVHSDHGDFMGNRNVYAATGIEHLLASEIVASHDSNGFRKVTNPVGQAIDLFSVFAGQLLRGLVDNAFFASSSQTALKMFTPPVGPIETLVTDERKMLETSFE